ncbi:hypothetical protein I7I48_10607 [Histoplasma ohiense]|nr:hypothetical protein I7I48_10607 [Histoplasma ohiense (nom. inval.)]
MKQADKLEGRKRETEMADEEDKRPLEMSDRTSNLGGDGQKRQSEGVQGGRIIEARRVKTGGWHELQQVT